VRGGISADGLQGYTWGYTTIVKPDGTTAPAKYLSYWVKRPEGWRVAAYRRRLRPAGEVSLALVAPSLPAQMIALATDAALSASYRASLDVTERAFSDSAKVIGLGVAFVHYGRPDAVNMGGQNDAAFVVGAEAIGRTVSDGKPEEPSTLVWAPDRVIVASAATSASRSDRSARQRRARTRTRRRCSPSLPSASARARRIRGATSRSNRRTGFAAAKSRRGLRVPRSSSVYGSPTTDRGTGVRAQLRCGLSGTAGPRGGVRTRTHAQPKSAAALPRADHLG
jgi:hypothetical protein